jgi:hypothetical protein
MKDSNPVSPITEAKPIYCPRRQQHTAVCETPNACAGGADCRLGPDLDSRAIMNHLCRYFGVDPEDVHQW